MNKSLISCCLILLFAVAGFASVKVDPVTGAVSNGAEQVTTSKVGFDLTSDPLAGLQTELDALYQEAYARKLVGQNADDVWARIHEILITLNGREQADQLDEGGESCTTAFVIPGLPFCETGNTNDNVNEYQPLPADRCGPDPTGPPVQGDGKEVVYTYTPSETEVVSISLCGSSYDTYLYIYANGCPGDPNAVFVCCSDDHDGACPSGSGSLTSCCHELALTAGVTYYIFVDGWSATTNGAYLFGMDYGIRCERCTPPPPPPCVECPDNAYHSIEELVCDGPYVDQINAGCIPGAAPLFEAISCNSVVCATAGTYQGATGGPVQDVDYYLLTVDAESESLNVALLADAPGTWAIWRANSVNLCENWSQLLFTDFERCQTSAFSRCVTPGVYVIGLIMDADVACGTHYTLTIHCLDCPEPTGRCCYRTADGPACADGLTREECLIYQGLWTEDATCEECCPTDFCTDYIDIPGVLEYIHTENSCCSVPVDFCVWQSVCGTGNCYNANRAIIYRFVIEDDAVMTLAAAGPGDNQLMVFTDCADPSGTCVASSDQATDNVGNIYQGAAEVISDLALPAGTYFVATSHYFWQDFPCGPITLRISSDTPLPVELLGFDALALDRAVQLSWATGAEQNSSHFDVLRDGVLATRVEATNSATGATYTWTDNNLTNGRLYHYELVAADLNGAQEVVGEVSAVPTAEGALVSEFALHQNYPNPFNPETVIAFDLPEAAVTTLRVINALGQEVATLVNGTLEAGRHTVSFDGSKLPSGLYFYQLQAGGKSELRKMVLLK